jgi:hypothetical protein
MSAIISDCGLYRYRLERDVSGTGQTVVIMVNPSTADAERDDPTIRKLKGFGERNNWGRIIVGNLFAYRATDVRELASATDPVGPLNDEHLRDMLAGANQIVFAWGPAGKLPKRLRARWRTIWNMVNDLGQQAYCIGAPAKDGNPCHPLMLAYERRLQTWRPAL